MQEDELRRKKLPAFLSGAEKNLRWKFGKNPQRPVFYTVKTQKGGQKLPAFFI